VFTSELTPLPKERIVPASPHRSLAAIGDEERRSRSRNLQSGSNSPCKSVAVSHKQNL
jgi:hypothetical protein